MERAISKLETTQVNTKVRIRQLKALRLATHPGRMREIGVTLTSWKDLECTLIAVAFER